MEFKSSDQPVDYLEAVFFMEDRVAAIYEDREDELIWFLEHPPIYTGGTSAKAVDLLNPQFPVFGTGRGGEYTYHGPGQLVVYIMLNLRKRQQAPDLKLYISNLENWIIASLAELGVKGERRDGRVGIWVDHSGKDEKIAAIGVRIRKWVTYHGISINIKPDLDHFKGIIPCGIKDAGVCSLESLGKIVDRSKVQKIFMNQWSQISF